MSEDIIIYTQNTRRTHVGHTGGNFNLSFVRVKVVMNSQSLFIIDHHDTRSLCRESKSWNKIIKLIWGEQHARLNVGSKNMKRATTKATKTTTIKSSCDSIKIYVDSCNDIDVGRHSATTSLLTQQITNEMNTLSAFSLCSVCAVCVLLTQCLRLKPLQIRSNYIHAYKAQGIRHTAHHNHIVRWITCWVRA